MAGHRNRLAVGLLALALAGAAGAQQGYPVYVANSAPSGACVGPRVWLSDTNPSVTYCCISSAWVSCTGGGGGAYTLPIASASVLGGIKVGSRLTITAGVLSADAQTLPPWTDANTIAAITADSSYVSDSIGNVSSMTLNPTYNTLADGVVGGATKIVYGTAVPTGYMAYLYNGPIANAFHVATGGQWTVDFWVYVPDFTASNSAVLQAGDVQGYLDMFVTLPPNVGLTARSVNVMSTWGLGSGVSTSFLITTLGWHHIALAYNYPSTTLVVYIDGVPTSFSWTSTSVSRGYITHGLWFGGASGLNFINSRLDNIRIHNTTRSAAWVSSVYAAGGRDAPWAPAYAGGSNTYVQFNDLGAFGGDAGFTYTKATKTVTMSTASGSDGLSFTTAGARLRLGPGTNDYLTSLAGTGISTPSSIAATGGFIGNASTATALSTTGTSGQFWSYNNTWATPAGGGGGSSVWVDAEIPSGLINGSNVTYTLGSTPSPSTSLRLYANGVRLRPTTDYSLATATITMVAPLQTGDWFYADYRTTTVGNNVDAEIPSGAINGSNTAFTLVNAAVPSTTLHVYLNGVRLRPTSDYTISGTSLTMVMVPQTGDWLYADYRY
jgi:hypothetical protein